MKILITGHTSGIGESLLDIFLKNEHSVYGISRNRSLKISNSSQINIDLSQENGIEDAYQWSKELNPDIFFHCAGSNPITPLVDASSKIYKDCFNLHFLSASQICRGCLESRNKDYFLKIFLISSIWSLISAHSRGPYSIAKSCLNSLAQQIAVEEGLNNVNAISIALGFVDTKLTALTRGDDKISNAKNRYLYPRNKFPKAEEVANFLYNLSTQDLSLINGSTIRLDGGILCQ